MYMVFLSAIRLGRQILNKSDHKGSTIGWLFCLKLATKKPEQRCIQNLVEHLRWSFLRKYLTAKSSLLDDQLAFEYVSAKRGQ